MSAENLACPNCGAPASSDSSKCTHCNARLATVACSGCFGMMFLGAKFCSHCGAKAARVESDAVKSCLCPRCQVSTRAVVIGGVDLRECARCEGLWVDRDTLEKVYSNKEQQTGILGVAAPWKNASASSLEKVRYLPCPECRQLMLRVNFARCSSVIVDVCKAHGTWFDKDELRRVVEFIQAGGMEKSRQRELDDLEAQRSRLESIQAMGPTAISDPASEKPPTLVDVVGALANAVSKLLR